MMNEKNHNQVLLDSITAFAKELCDPSNIFKQDIEIHKGIAVEIPPHITTLIQQISETPLHKGKIIGRFKHNTFIPSTTLLERIQQHTTKYIKVDENTAWLFTCARDIFPENIIERGYEANNYTTKKVLVIDNNKRVIGIAKRQKRTAGTIYKNIIDIGKALRDEITIS
ncbi:MAG: hypothetical protein ACQESC_01110 [Nanobdellota archaeon]